MRKKTVTAIVVAALLLCGCASGGNAGPINSKSDRDDKPVSTELPETPVSEEDKPLNELPDVSELPPLSGLGGTLSDEDQIQIIWENRDKWMFSGHIDEGWNIFYAVSDLDANGRLEIIATEAYGESNFSSFSMYEVDEAGTGLKYVENNIMEGESMPDIEWGEVFTLAKDQDGTILGYIMKDGLRMDGGSAYSVNMDFVTMKDGKITCEYIASANTSYDENGTVTTQYFVDKNGNYLEDWEEFNAYEEKYIKETYPDAEIKVMVICSIYANETGEDGLYDLLEESWRKHGEYDSFDEYYRNEYSQGAGEDGKGSDWIDQNGELTTKTVSKEDLENCQYCAFETYVYEMNTYHDYQSDDDFQTHTLYFDTEGGGSFYYYGYNGTEDWTITEITFDEEPSFYAYAKMKNGDYEMNSVLQFYTFTFSDGGSTLDVIGLDFGEEYIYFWPFG